ncbi:MAG: glycosyltransferase family 1 protein, partial [bacterium]|nr:glycosyltransferase family 1 protein [bacterium]
MANKAGSSVAPLRLHAKLSPLAELARNLHWTWDPDCQALFAAADPAGWKRSEHNPVKMLKGLKAPRQKRLVEDAKFMAHLRRCGRTLRSYLSAKTWYREKYGRRFKDSIAYFSMEYGLCEALPIYAGGLGVLAGDHLKSVSDLGIPLVGVGIFWKQGYTRQLLDGAGHQVDRFKTLEPADTPAHPIMDRTGRRLRIKLPIGGEKVVVQGWRVDVGRMPLVLLDTDAPGNNPRACQMTRRLYSGDRDTRIRQEILLGVGGWRFLQAMGMRIGVCHLNEGHAAFAALERIAELMKADGCTFAQAKRHVAATDVFTTHTPVPAGNETFQVDLLRRYVGHYAGLLGLDDNAFIDLGRVHPGDHGEQFGMTPLACRTSDRRNGVSALHGAVARRMWKDLWPKKKAADV